MSSPAASLLERLSTLFWTIGGIVLILGLFGAPFALYTRYRRKYGQSQAFQLSWSDMSMYTIPYSLQKGGVLALAYATISFLHAALLLQSLAPLKRARKLQAQEA
jgi:hypothetical protein